MNNPIYPIGTEDNIGRDWEARWGDDPRVVAAIEAGERFGEEEYQKIMREVENDV